MRTSYIIQLGRSFFLRLAFVPIFAICFQQSLLADDALHNTCVASGDSCDFYLCKQDELGCDDLNYLFRFGYRYCEKYRVGENNFDPATRIVLQRLRFCLQHEMSDEQGLSCSGVRPAAIHHHFKCYTTQGFCDLPWLEKLKIYRVVRRTMREPDYRKSMWAIQRACRSNHSGIDL